MQKAIFIESDIDISGQGGGGGVVVYSPTNYGEAVLNEYKDQPVKMPPIVYPEDSEIPEMPVVGPSEDVDVKQVLPMEVPEPSNTGPIPPLSTGGIKYPEEEEQDIEESKKFPWWLLILIVLAIGTILYISFKKK